MNFIVKLSISIELECLSFRNNITDVFGTVLRGEQTVWVITIYISMLLYLKQILYHLSIICGTLPKPYLFF